LQIFCDTKIIGRDSVIEAQKLEFYFVLLVTMSSPERKSFTESDGKLEKKRAASVTAIQAETENIYTDDALDPIYQAKARILNDALQEIGMGKYQVGPASFPPRYK
jgi:hypothetical protein